MAPARAALLAVLLAGAGCHYTIDHAPAGALGALRQGGRPGGLVLTAADGGRVRLDPSSRLRFRRTDGSVTRWVSARDLGVSAAGVHTESRVPLATFTRARVEALDATRLRALRAAAPPGAVVAAAGADAAEVTAPPGALGPWFDAFTRAIARWYVPAPRAAHFELVARACQAPGAPDCMPDERAPRCECAEVRAAGASEFIAARAVLYVRDALGGAPFGRWRLVDARLGPLAPRTATDLLAAGGAGVAVPDGLAWGDVAGAEINNLSGGKSFLTLVGTVALAAALAPLGVVGGGRHRGGGGPRVARPA
ncbi:MAG TPA: hypothetical protein VGQ83_16965, partial [Polyangia bacterium]